MRLTVFALSCPPPELPDSIRVDFGTAGGRIGRGAGCTLVLRDPNRHISREHAEIRWRGGEFVLKVVSKVNSVAVDDTSIGPGEAVPLAHGAQVAIGDYVLGVEIDESAQLSPFEPGAADPLAFFTSLSTATKAEAQNDTSPDWFRRPAEGYDVAPTEQSSFDALIGGFPASSPLADVLGAERPTLSSSPPQVELSPVGDGVESFLRSLDSVAPPAPSEPVAHPELYRSGSLSVPFQTVAPRQEAQGTAFAWDEDIFRSLEQDFGPSAAENAAAAPVPALERAPAAGAPSAPAEQSAPAAQSPLLPVSEEGGAQLIGVLAEALGLEARELDASRPEETIRVVGQLLRLATDGLFRLLEMRSQLKAELRIEDRTMIASRENNPLKHADNARDAVTYLVDLRQHGNKLFMPPDRAIQDTISDICAHEMAVMAGTRAALLAALKMFSPEVVEKRIKRTGALENVVPALHKSRLWERFLSMYAELEQEAEQNFDRLLNAEFSKAYSEQTKLLRKRR